MSIFTFSKNSFEGELPGEETIFLTRKHNFYLILNLVLILFLVLFIFSVYFVIRSFEWYSKIASIFWFLVSALFLFLWNFAFYQIMIYCLNTVIITNKRIIENKQLGFFAHQVNEVSFERIQDISIKIYGPLAEFLKFGDIEIQTAGTVQKFTFTQLPNPKKIKEIIWQVKEANLNNLGYEKK